MDVQISGASVASSTVSYMIPANGALRLETDDSPSLTHVCWAQLAPVERSTPVATGLYSYTRDGILATETAISPSTPTTHARIYVDQTSSHDPGFAVDDTAVEVTLHAYEMDGITTAGSGAATIELSGYGHRAAFVDELISDLPDQFTGILDIQASTPFAAMAVRSLTNERNDFLVATFPVADYNRSAPSPIIFPQIDARDLEIWRDPLFQPDA